LDTMRPSSPPITGSTGRNAGRNTGNLTELRGS
jgi:hypothetical protein